MIGDPERAADIDRWRVVGTAVVLIVAALALGGVVSGTAAGGETPGEPASFFGSATDEDGAEIPEGVSIVGVVDGGAVSEIEIHTDGEYGGDGAFDDKLRIDNTAGDEVTFRLGDADGPAADTVDLEAGVFERDLVFPGGAIEYVHPEAAIDVTPTSATPNETIDFSAAESSAHDDAELAAFLWTVHDDGDEIATFDGESVGWHSDVEGTYEVELEVVDTAGFTDTTTATFNISSEEVEEIDVETKSSDDDGGSGSTGGGGSTAGGGGGTTTGGSGSDSSLNESDDTNETGSNGTDGDSSSAGESDRTAEPIADETVRIDDVFPDAAGTTVILDDPSMREIVFTNDSVSGDVTIREFDEIASDAPPLSEELRIVSASVIDVPANQVDDAAVIRAIVDPEWLRARDLAPDQLTVYRFPTDGERWHELPTEAFEVDRGVVVEAETPGFSQFVIAGPEAPERSGSKATPGDGNETSDPTTAPPDVEASAVLTELADGSGDSGGIGPIGLVFALVSVLVVVWVGGRFLIPRRPDSWMP